MRSFLLVHTTLLTYQIISPNRLLLGGLGQDGDHLEAHDRVDSLVGWNHETELVASANGTSRARKTTLDAKRLLAHLLWTALGPPCRHDGGVHFAMLWNGR